MDDTSDPHTTEQPIYDSLQHLFLQDAPLSVWLNRASVSGIRTNVHGYQPWNVSIDSK